MKKILMQVSFCVVMFLVSATAFSTVMSAKLTQVKNTCHCQGCNLSNSNFERYQPGSEDKNVNPLASHLEKNSCQLTCDFKKSNLSHANLQNTNFTACYKGYVTPLKKADFTRANLMFANLQHGIFIFASFKEARLSHTNAFYADFTMSDLNSANFSGSNLQHAKILGNLMSGQGSDMRNANFFHADLSYADFYGMLAGANFSYANFNNTKISTSSEAYFEKMGKIPDDDLWRNTNFSNTDLRKVELINKNGKLNLQKALFCRTIMPDGKINNRDCKKVMRLPQAS